MADPKKIQDDGFQVLVEGAFVAVAIVVLYILGVSLFG